ncbi:hypothetical protein ACE04B_33695, partial [Rhizobium phaseoli]
MAARRRWCAGANCRASRRNRCIWWATRMRRIEMSVLRENASPADSSAIAGTLDVAATPAPHSLIPVLVTGIQPPRVRAVNDSFLLASASLAPKDLGALDSCDKHRNEGV